jgi:hypothetical protein
MVLLGINMRVWKLWFTHRGRIRYWANVDEKSYPNIHSKAQNWVLGRENKNKLKKITIW